MTVVFLALIIAASLLPIAPLAAAPAETARRTEFAVIPDVKELAHDWLPIGVAFDLEKRLGRLPTLDAADRMTVAAALQNAVAGDDASRARAVTARSSAKIVLCVKATYTPDVLSLKIDLWAGQRQVASFERNGAREDLFKLVDRLVDDILPELGKLGIDAPKPESVPGLKWWPCRSVAAYEYLVKGILSVQSGDVARARACLAKTLAIEADNWFARYFLGAVALREGDIAKAAEYCREAIVLNPEVYAGVYANLSYCCAAMGDDKQADWAKAEFERRTGKPLPARTVPGAMPLFGARP